MRGEREREKRAVGIKGKRVILLEFLRNFCVSRVSRVPCLANSKKNT